MKNTFFILIMTLTGACASHSYQPEHFYRFQSEASIPISVTRFSNQAAQTGNDSRCRDWNWFGPDLGNAFSALTIDEFKHYQNLRVLERETIHQINEDEVNLVNAEKSAAIPKGHFKRARYTLVGVVNSFEYCSGGSGLKAASYLSESLLGVGLNREKATVQVSLRLIDTKTGEVLATSIGDGSQNRDSASFGGLTPRFAVGSQVFRQSSLSDAIREAIHDGTVKLFTEAKL